MFRLRRWETQSEIFSTMKNGLQAGCSLEVLPSHPDNFLGEITEG
jgi:hypothetical protein